MRLIIGLFTILVVVTGLVGFMFLTITESKDCSQFVIDSYEMHSRIDIPKVESINCYYDEQKNIRLSIYSLRNYFQIDKYLIDHKFTPVTAMEVDLPIPLDENEQPSEMELHAVAGTRWGNEWRYVLEKESRRLWIEIKYN